MLAWERIRPGCLVTLKRVNDGASGARRREAINVGSVVESPFDLSDGCLIVAIVNRFSRLGGGKENMYVVYEYDREHLKSCERLDYRAVEVKHG